MAANKPASENESKQEGYPWQFTLLVSSLMLGMIGMLLKLFGIF